MSNTKGIIAETQSSLEEGLLNSAEQPSNRILTPYNGSVALFPYITTGLHHMQKAICTRKDSRVNAEYIPKEIVENKVSPWA